MIEVPLRRPPAATAGRASASPRAGHSPRPRRIAFVNPNGEIGGAERALLLLLQGLDRTRYAPTVFCFAGGRLVEALGALDVPVRVLPLGRAETLSRFAGGWRAALPGVGSLGRAAGTLLPLLRAAHPDLIHTNGIKAHLVGGVCGRLLRRPVLWHMRDWVPEGRLRTLLRGAASSLPRHIVAVSGPVTDQFAGCRAARYATTLHDAVDLARYQPRRPAAAVRAELGIAPETVTLAMVAHFGPWKGHLAFLDLMARLVREGAPVAGLIVGGAIYRTAGHEGYEAAVRARARELGLTRHVHFTGYQECVPDFLNAADLLVHPPTRPEPFGLALIEAMALGKPVVAPAAGGPLEIVAPGVTGLLVPPADAAALHQAVRVLVHDPVQRAAMGRHGRARVVQRFTPEIHLAQIGRLYHQLCPATVADAAAGRVAGAPEQQGVLG
jgi:glycosyltransferase involved in cell wall biosynthesis